MTEIKLKDQECLLKQGIPSQKMYLLKKGKLGVYVFDEKEGSSVLVKEILEGEIVGEMSIMLGMPPSATVMSLGESVVNEVNKERIKEIEKNLPSWYVKIVHNLAERLVNTNKLLKK